MISDDRLKEIGRLLAEQPDSPTVDAARELLREVDDLQVAILDMSAEAGTYGIDLKSDPLRKDSQRHRAEWKRRKL